MGFAGGGRLDLRWSYAVIMLSSVATEIVLRLNPILLSADRSMGISVRFSMSAASSCIRRSGGATRLKLVVL